MFTIPEQLSTATKANLETQIAMFNTFFNKAFESAEKIVDLNMQAAKASFDDSVLNAKQLMSAKDFQDFYSMGASQAQPNAEKLLAYIRHLANIASGAQAEITKTAEAHITETSRKIISLVDEVSKNAPAGTEHAVTFVKTAIGNANASYEQFASTTRQAVDALESNLNTAATQFSQAAAKTNAKNMPKKS